MSKIITSKVIGQLTQDSEFSDWWLSAEIEIPFLNNQKLNILFTGFEPEKDTNFIKEADNALTNFLNLTTEDRKFISRLVYKNCMDFLDAVDFDEADEPLKQIKNQDEIWNYVYPTQIYVSRRHRRDKDVYVQMVCESEWEQEHGLQLIFRQGKLLTRLSSQDGHLTEADAYNKPDEDDDLLSKFNMQ